MKKVLFALLLFTASCNNKPTQCGEYQINLEPDSIHVMDGNRIVAVLPYSKIGTLDNVFINDNE